jgi:hypothetical protein
LVIPALSTITQDRVELRLCPVKCLTFYLERAVLHRGTRETLFFPYSKKSRVTRTALARWMKIIIVHAYRWADPEQPLPGRPTAHEIRAIATSYAALREVSLDHIITQCRWGTHSVFTSTYLRDMHDLSFISTVPVVAAAATLQPS